MSSDMNAVIVVNQVDPKSGEYSVQLWHEGRPLDEVRLRINRQLLLEHEHAFSAAAYGMELFDAIFAGAVGRAYQRLIGQAGPEGTIRVQLVISQNAPELHALPWERLFHLVGDKEVALAAAAQTPFSRFLMTGLDEQPPAVERTLRMLVAIANPVDLPTGVSPLHVASEISALANLLAELRDRVHVTILPGHTGLSAEQHEQLLSLGAEVRDGVTSWQAIQRHLPGCHILHILAHGLFRTDKRTAYLFLEHPGDEYHLVGAMDHVADADIANGLAGVHPLPQLVFLAACESAKRPEDGANPFVGLAPQLVQAGVPAVVAMQDLVTMDMARSLTGDFYRRLFDHGQVDLALNEARSLLFEKDQFEWAIPVLFLRLRDGCLFRPSTPPAELFTADGGATQTRPVALTEERTFLEAELAQHRRNLLRLCQQKAVYAEGEVPLRLLNQIDAEEQKIQELNNRISEM
jgi:hypothetical protein